MKLAGDTPRRAPSVGRIPVADVEISTVEVELVRVPKLLRRDKVAELLDVSEDTVDRLSKAGRLRRIDVSANAVRFRLEDVLAFLEAAAHEGEHA